MNFYVTSQLCDPIIPRRTMAVDSLVSLGASDLPIDMGMGSTVSGSEDTVPTACCVVSVAKLAYY